MKSCVIHVMTQEKNSLKIIGKLSEVIWSASSNIESKLDRLEKK